MHAAKTINSDNGLFQVGGKKSCCDAALAAAKLLKTFHFVRPKRNNPEGAPAEKALGESKVRSKFKDYLNSAGAKQNLLLPGFAEIGF